MFSDLVCVVSEELQQQAGRMLAILSCGGVERSQVVVLRCVEVRVARDSSLALGLVRMRDEHHWQRCVRLGRLRPAWGDLLQVREQRRRPD